MPQFFLLLFSLRRSNRMSYDHLYRVFTLSDCLNSLGFTALSRLLLKRKNSHLINECVIIVQEEAENRGDLGVLSKLENARLIQSDKGLSI